MVGQSSRLTVLARRVGFQQWMFASQPGLFEGLYISDLFPPLFPNSVVFSTEAWPLLGNLEDPELRRLAQSLPAMVLRSKADSTTKKHLGAFQQWKIWADAR